MILLSLIPPVWKAAINPTIDALRKGEKPSDEVKKAQENVVFYFNVIASIVLTYVMFFVVGFNKIE